MNDVSPESLSEVPAVHDALTNFFLWRSWYPDDLKGAVEFANDQRESEADVIEFAAALRRLEAQNGERS
jgi:hypothetical protein